MDKKEVMEKILLKESEKDYDSIVNIVKNSPRVKVYKKTSDKFISPNISTLRKLEKDIKNNSIKYIDSGKDDIFSEALKEIISLNKKIEILEKKLLERSN